MYTSTVLLFPSYAMRATDSIDSFSFLLALRVASWIDSLRGVFDPPFVLSHSPAGLQY